MRWIVIKMIDLSLLHSNTIDKIEINEEYELDKSYYENTDIKSLDKIKVKGIITKKDDEEDYINCTITSSMVIPDSISLEDIKYPFEVEYDDYLDKNYLKNENLLDIYEFLWENIVLEIPLHFTEVEDLSKFQGDGWKLISEDELSNKNNPFSDLLKDMEKEWL